MSLPARRCGAARAGPALAAVALALALAAGAGGCVRRIPPPDLSSDPAELLAAVKAAQAGAARVEGRARVAVEAPEGAGGVEQYLAAEKPGRVRVESYDFFGNVLSVLAVDGGELRLYDAKEKVFYRGPATAENIGRLVPVALPPEALATLLCGSAPLLDGEPVSAVPGNGTWVLTLRRGAVRQVLEIGPGAAVISSRLRRDGPDGPAPTGLEADFSDFKARGGVRVPTGVEARAPVSGVSLSLRWKELAVNAPVDPALFTLAPPLGSRLVDLGPAGP